MQIPHVIGHFSQMKAYLPHWPQPDARSLQVKALPLSSEIPVAPLGSMQFATAGGGEAAGGGAGGVRPAHLAVFCAEFAPTATIAVSSAPLMLQTLTTKPPVGSVYSSP